VRYFIERNRIRLRRIYWVSLVLVVSAIIVVPLVLGAVNPTVRLPQFHGGPPPELMREWERVTAQARRERGRVNDFVTMVNHMLEEYPFLGVAADASGEDFVDLAMGVYLLLREEARYLLSSAAFIEFVEVHFLSRLRGYGTPRLTREGQELADFILEPYFFGYYDFRFYDDRFAVPVRGGNVASYMLGDGIAYVRVNRFLPKGYELVTRNPFWYFDFDQDRQYLMDFYQNLYGIDDLIIDIRGIGSGFGDYFLPLILEPHMRQPMRGQFYAFHADTFFTARVSRAYREWYGHDGGTSSASALAQDFVYALPENVTRGFPIVIDAQPPGDAAFDGQVWLLTDSENFSGPNFMYLQMARDAGFMIIYQQNPYATGWATSSPRVRGRPHTLSYGVISLRFNPLYFTDAQGRSLEVAGAFYDYPLADVTGEMGAVLADIDGRE